MNESTPMNEMNQNEDSIYSSDRYQVYGPALLALLYTITSSAWLPIAALYVAWQIGPPYDKSALNGSISASLYAAIPFLYFGLIINNAFAPGGLAVKFLDWPGDICAAIRKTSSKFLYFCVPMFLAYSIVEYYQGGKWNDSFGRICFLASMVVLAIGLRQTRITIARIRKAAEQTPRSDLGLVFWPRTLLRIFTLMPIALVVMSAIGYHFTAVQLSWRLLWMLAITLAIGLATSVARKMLLTSRLRHNRAHQLSGRDYAADVDGKEVKAQVNRLLRVTSIAFVVVFAWQIWSDVLPAITYLDEFKLWESANSLKELGVHEWITVRDLLVSIGVLVVTWILSRNLPGILEIVLLERLPLDRGGRYAISFVLRYLVGIIGSLMACEWLGFAWSSLQWMVAGLTVGLGFGLQEIFANLVSGIIILLERPVRVGDFVTVNGVTGHVSQMQLRATTIKDLDHREMIVPNKKFITDDVINWTLSDRTTRLIIKVGIAYGSDTELAEKVLYEAAREHRMVKAYPRPEVVFTSFGDSTLDFELRVTIPTRDVYWNTLHELNMAVDGKFREQGIEIAFPQQDVHLHGFENALKDAASKDAGPQSKLSVVGSSTNGPQVAKAKRRAA